MNHSAFGGQLLMGPGAQQPAPDPFLGSISMLNALVENDVLKLIMETPSGPVIIHKFLYDGYNETKDYAAIRVEHNFKEGGTATSLMVFKKFDHSDVDDAHIAQQYPVACVSLEQCWKMSYKLHATLSEKSLLKTIDNLGGLPKNLKIGDTLVLKDGQKEDVDAFRTGAQFVVGGPGMNIVPEQRVIYAGNANAYQRYRTSRLGVVYMASTDSDEFKIREVDLLRYRKADHPLLDKKGIKQFVEQLDAEREGHMQRPKTSMLLSRWLGGVVHHAAALIIAGTALFFLFGPSFAHAAVEKPPLVLKPITLPEKQPDGFSYVYCVNKVCHDIYTNENILIDNVDKDGYYSYVTSE